MTKRRSYRCEHGLDLRVHPRCYLCQPLVSQFVPAPQPIGCTCPPNWLGVIPPACPIHNPPNPTITWPTITTGGTNGFEVRCTCPADRGANYFGSCPIHDTQISYTAGGVS